MSHVQVSDSIHQHCCEMIHAAVNVLVPPSSNCLKLDKDVAASLNGCRP